MGILPSSGKILKKTKSMAHITVYLIKYLVFNQLTMQCWHIPTLRQKETHYHPSAILTAVLRAQLVFDNNARLDESGY